MKPDLDSLTAVFEAELSKHGMVMADGYATEAITSAGVIDEWAARQLARDLVRQRSPEKPGMDMLVDADTVEMNVRDVAKLIWALAEGGRAGSGVLTLT